MAHAWADFVGDATPTGHGVQIYGRIEELTDSVVAYLEAGFEKDSPALVVATPDHWTQFAEKLRADGWDTQRLEHSGLLTLADADPTLNALMTGERPDPMAFEAVVGGLLDGVAEQFPGRPIRAFGEMVDLLCEQDRHDAAAALEELWNELAETRTFSLLCGYRLDIFDRASQLAPLPDVCRLHSHVQPTADRRRLTRAVDRALEEVLGSRQAGHVYMLCGQQVREERTPLAQLALMWVSKNMPVRADRVLATARAHYYANAA